MTNPRRLVTALVGTAVVALAAAPLPAQQAPGTASQQPAPPRRPRTQKPPLHARHWMAITGKPLAATAGAMMFQRGGNAVDAAMAMLAATCTMWDTLSCGGETQALVYHPGLKKVIGVNGLGVAPTGATPAYYRSKGHAFPPEHGPLAAVTPGTPGALMVMLAEWGTLPLAEVLAPAIQLADGFPIEAQLVGRIAAEKRRMRQWKYSAPVMLPHAGAEGGEPPEPGEIFVQKDLADTFRKLVDAERKALAAGKSRKDAIMAAYDRFYRGDIAAELVRGTREEGGLFTMQDLAQWKPKIEEPVSVSYKGIEVYKLQFWQQGPAMLQALNILENADLRAMGYNSPRYMHAVYQAMSLAFADRDFWYGDPYQPPEEPTRGLLSKEYAKQRYASIDWARNDPAIRPGDPYPFQGGTNPFKALLAQWDPAKFTPRDSAARSGQQDRVVPAQRDTTRPATPPVTPERREPPADGPVDLARVLDSLRTETFRRGTTSIISADTSGWVVSITPSGGWVPAVIAGRTGIGLSQRAQSFVLDPKDGPFNVMKPGQHPRVTLTPTLALRDGQPWLAFAVQGGDSQDQNLLQFFLNIVEFGMTPQQAAEAPNVNSYQMRASFGEHETRPGRMLVASSTPESVRQQLRAMGYTLEVEERTSGPINAILFDRKHRTMWGASSNHGEDYGIGW
jgi:gamma-glutamyltranspeptidase/glutathione hydrolase